MRTAHKDDLIGKRFGDSHVIARTTAKKSQNKVYLLQCGNGHLFLERRGNLTKEEYPRNSCPFCFGTKKVKRVLHKAQKNNETTGILGVTIDKRSGRARARIDINGNRIELYADSVDDAAELRKSLERLKELEERR